MASGISVYQKPNAWLPVRPRQESRTISHEPSLSDWGAQDFVVTQEPQDRKQAEASIVPRLKLPWGRAHSRACGCTGYTAWQFLKPIMYRIQTGYNSFHHQSHS